jgi:hypothetical protein
MLTVLSGLQGKKRAEIPPRLKAFNRAESYRLQLLLQTLPPSRDLHANYQLAWWITLSLGKMKLA